MLHLLRAPHTRTRLPCIMPKTVLLSLACREYFAGLPYVSCVAAKRERTSRRMRGIPQSNGCERMLHPVYWNLFLAIIPVPLGYLTAWALSKRGEKRNLPVWLAFPIALAWLVFLPNICYLLTEWRHLLFDAPWAGLRDRGDSDP